MPRCKQSRRDSGGGHMLSFLQAVKLGDLAKVRELLSNGCSVNHHIVFLDGDCMRKLPPLCAAVDCGNRDMVRGLIEAGAQVNVRCVNTWKPFRMQSMSPLFMACRTGQLDIIQTLVEAGAQVNGSDYNLVEQEEEGGSMSFSDSANTCLHQAVIAKQYDVMEKLLSCGADPCVLNGGLETPLHLACELHHLRCIKILVKAGGLFIQSSPLVASPMYFILDSWRNEKKEKELARLMIAAGYDLRKDRMMEVLFYQPYSRYLAKLDQQGTARQPRAGGDPSQVRESADSLNIGRIDLNQTGSSIDIRQSNQVLQINGVQQPELFGSDMRHSNVCVHSLAGPRSQELSGFSMSNHSITDHRREDIWKWQGETEDVDWAVSDDDDDEDTGWEEADTHDFEGWVLKRFGPQFCRFLAEAPCFPPRLMFMCRLVVRRACGNIRLTQKLQKLPVPMSVKRYLNLEIL